MRIKKKNNDINKIILVNTGRNVEKLIGMRIKKNNDNKILIRL
jgi:hypothetical protein